MARIKRIKRLKINFTYRGLKNESEGVFHRINVARFWSFNFLTDSEQYQSRVAQLKTRLMEWQMSPS